MQINSAFSSGIYGLNQASQQMTESSLSIADQTTTNQIETQQANPEGVSPHSYTSGPVTTELVNMKLAEVQAQAATKVITTADEMVGSLIDVTV